MITSKSWSGIKVKDFFCLLPWQPQLVTNQVIEEQDSDWRSISVKEFFSKGNWNGLEIVKSPSLTTENLLTLKVEQFFSSINWEGDALIAAVAELNSLAKVELPSEDNLTLSDLSDLF